MRALLDHDDDCDNTIYKKQCYNIKLLKNQ
jgi:hypothetical protein